jgi:uncharacterized protein YecA (UPF0149 family)
MYALHLHPEAIYRELDDAREYEVLCELHKLRAEAARRVPEWCPEMRTTLHRQEADWGEDWYE